MKNAIVGGASSGVDKELARVLAAEGYTVGMAARRVDLLKELTTELPAESRIEAMDVADSDAAMVDLQCLIAEMGDVELFVLNAGVDFSNWKLDWEPERDTIDVNVAAFAATANVAVQHIVARGGGSLVGISSIAALHGYGEAPAYNASKAFMSNYMGGLRHKFARQNLPITVTDAQPGFVDTAMLKADDPFWVASPEKAVQQIYNAIVRRRKHVYISRRWRLIAWVIKLLPDWIAHKI